MSSSNAGRPEELLSGLDPEQRAAAQTLRGPLCIVAGAGTGKTRAITHRIAYGVATGVYQPTEVLALTFTTRAAGEMRSRLQQLDAPGVQARTFHSAALRQARYFWPQVYDSPMPEIMASKFALVSEAAAREGVRAETSVVRDLASAIEWSKVSNHGPADYAAVAARTGREVGDLAPGTVAAIYQLYEDLKRDRGRLDFEDVLLVTAAILADEPRIAATVRSQYRWFVVDEYQDVNPLQAMLLDLWLGGRDDICVVGDPRQTIYAFAGATPGSMREFARKYPQAERVELVRNYRSTPQIVAVANAVFGRRTQSYGPPLEAQAEPGAPVSYRGHADETAEAAAVADEIVRLHRDGTPYREMAILFRINAQSETFEEALGERGVPFTLRGVEGYFSRPEVRQAVTLLRGAARAGQDDDSGTLADQVRSVLASMGHTDAAPSGTGASRDRWESLHALVTMAEDFAAVDADTDAAGVRPPAATLSALVDDLDRRAQTAHAPTADGVTLATLHAAKGLEWDAVFCAGMHEGMMPISYADTREGVEEEQRLFYVGVTRARRALSISWSRARRPGGNQRRSPTRFLDTLLPADHPARGAGGGPRPKRRTNAELEALEPADRALYERLKVWRAEQAAEQKVPAFVVFNDATLLALVEIRPRHEHELVTVPGIGQAKRERYGAALLEILADA